ncbi:hypothetical protein N431DRAFT_73157 [Stipitochalara longipes BDJ]|nr:hypothetical protein N431DRAFT_73157 [Stipitochalara longipes BDJ]
MVRACLHRQHVTSTDGYRLWTNKKLRSLLGYGMRQGGNLRKALLCLLVRRWCGTPQRISLIGCRGSIISLTSKPCPTLPCPCPVLYCRALLRLFPGEFGQTSRARLPVWSGLQFVLCCPVTPSLPALECGVTELPHVKAPSSPFHLDPGSWPRLVTIPAVADV